MNFGRVFCTLLRLYVIFLIKLYMKQHKNNEYLDSVKPENIESLNKAVFEINGLVHLTHNVIYLIKFFHVCIFFNFKVPLNFSLNSTEIFQMHSFLTILENLKAKSQINGLNLSNSIRDRMNIMVTLINMAIKTDNESIDLAKIINMMLVSDISKTIYENEKIYSDLGAANETELLISIIGPESNNILLEYKEDLTQESQFVHDANKLILALLMDKSKPLFNGIVTDFIENISPKIRHPGLKSLTDHLKHSVDFHIDNID